MEVKSKQASLPKLMTAGELKEEKERRDSLSSLRTGDSGYGSERDISLSPLEFLGQDNGHTLAYFQPPLPSLSFEYINISSPVDAKSARVRSILSKRFGEGQKPALVNKVEITSNPTCSPVAQSVKPDWTKAFKNPSEARSVDITSRKEARKEDVQIWIDDSIPSHNRPDKRVSSIVSISSSGSADMYSMTEDSDDDEVPELGLSILSKATLKTIDLIMRKIEVNLGYAAYMQCAGGQTSRRPSGQAETSRTTGRGSGQGAGGGKRKSRTEEGTPSENPDDDGPTKRRRVSIATTEDSEIGPRFACPFFKHDPNRYRNRRTCPGPGWPTVHRMKEHLYRAHAQPIFCPRCYTMFDSDNEFSAHLRSHPCQISAPQPIDGIDRETLMGLRKRSPALRLEEDKWRDTYKLLFPDVEGANIPSPYYDTNSPTEESRQFRRVLLGRIRQELFATAEQETGPVEQNLLRQVADIIQRCESDLLASLHPAPTQSQPHPSLPPTQQLPLDHYPPTNPPNGPANRAQTQVPYHPRPQPQTTAPGGQAAHPQPTAPPQPFFNDPQHPQWVPLPWEEHPPTPSSEWIDWAALFPPGSEGQAGLGEARPTLVTPVWT